MGFRDGRSWELGCFLFWGGSLYFVVFLIISGAVSPLHWNFKLVAANYHIRFIRIQFVSAGTAETLPETQLGVKKIFPRSSRSLNCCCKVVNYKAARYSHSSS